VYKYSIKNSSKYRNAPCALLWGNLDSSLFNVAPFPSNRCNCFGVELFGFVFVKVGANFSRCIKLSIGVPVLRIGLLTVVEWLGLAAANLSTTWLLPETFFVPLTDDSAKQINLKKT